MRYLHPLVGLVSLTTVACAEEAQQPVVTVIDPGEWEVVETSRPRNPGDWPRKSPPRRKCVTEALAAAPTYFELFANGERDSDTRVIEDRFENGRVIVRLETDAPDGDLRNIPMKVSGTYTRSTVRVKVHVMGFEAANAVARRVGECPAE